MLISISQEVMYLIFAVALRDWQIASCIIWVGKVVIVLPADIWSTRFRLIYLRRVTFTEVPISLPGVESGAGVSAGCPGDSVVLLGHQPPGPPAKLLFFTKALKTKTPHPSLFMVSRNSHPSLFIGPGDLDLCSVNKLTSNKV